MITRLLPPTTVGVDLNPRNLQKARQYAPRASFVLCDAEGTIPLRSQSFDLAICTETLEHLLRPLAALAEVHRLLTPAGVLLGSVPGRSPLWRWRWASSSRNSFSEEPYHKHYSRAELSSLLERYFSIERLYSKYFEMNWFFIVVKKDPV